MDWFIITIIIQCVITLVIAGLIIAQIIRAKKKSEALEDATENAVQEEELGEDVAEASEPVTETREVLVAEAVEEDEVTVKFAANENTFVEAYNELTDEQKGYCDKIYRYALSKVDAIGKDAKTARIVQVRHKPILKLKMRRGNVVAAFKVVSDLLRDFRRQAESTDDIKVKETEVYITDETSVSTACGMIDLMVEQYEHERELARERAREARARKAQERKQALNESSESSVEGAAETISESAENEVAY